MKLLVLLCSISLTLACNKPKPYDCKCGVSKSTSKIVGGEDAEKHEFPWQVFLVSRWLGKRQYCGGSLLSSTSVLTAAHCLARHPAPWFRAYVGSHIDIYTDDGEQRILIKHHEIHPDYVIGKYEFDFAIGTLEKPVTFSDKAYPICLPTEPSSNYEDRDATVTGWGVTDEGIDLIKQPLQKVNVRTMSNTACLNTGYANHTIKITSDMICAFAPGKDSCQGDSGGPLIIKKTGANYYEQAGIVSWGEKCALPDYPGVNSRVTFALDWIKSKITGTTCPIP